MVSIATVSQQKIQSKLNIIAGHGQKRVTVIGEQFRQILILMLWLDFIWRGSPLDL